MKKKEMHRSASSDTSPHYKTLCKGWVGSHFTCLHHFFNLVSNRGSPPQPLLQSKQIYCFGPFWSFPQYIHLLKFKHDCSFLPIHSTIVARFSYKIILNHSKFHASIFIVLFLLNWISINKQSGLQKPNDLLL